MVFHPPLKAGGGSGENLGLKMGNCGRSTWHRLFLSYNSICNLSITPIQQPPQRAIIDHPHSPLLFPPAPGFIDRASYFLLSLSPDEFIAPVPLTRLLDCFACLSADGVEKVYQTSLSEANNHQSAAAQKLLWCLDIKGLPSNMSKVELPYATFEGTESQHALVFHGIPYAQPFQRFESPQPLIYSNETHTTHDARNFGYNCPQLPSRLENVMGRIPDVDFSRQSETHCNVLSIYGPRDNDGTALPVIVWVHGGAYITGGSQLPWYDGSRLAKDGHVIVVCINYRLGVFGFLHQEHRHFSCAVEDVIVAFEWVRSYISCFGGDPAQITAVGQSAGAYLIQTISSIRADLFVRAILHSSPAESALSTEEACKVRLAVEAHLPSGKTTSDATTQELLAAQGLAMRSLPDMLVHFGPTHYDNATMSLGSDAVSISHIDFLVGWTQHDGSPFTSLGLQSGGTPKWLAETLALDLSKPVTARIFREPSLRLSRSLQQRGCEVVNFEVCFAPLNFPLGAAHCIDLPLLFGDEAAWKASPMRGDVPWSVWESKGRNLRQQWSAFSRSATIPESTEDLVVYPQ
jgi:para-nitrobenzyl esterase